MSTQTTDLFFYKGEGSEAAPEYLIENGGLISYIRNAKIQERRVTVNEVSEIQDLLDAGESLVLYKIGLNYMKKWRFKRVLKMDNTNTYIDGEDIIYRDQRRPAAENNIFWEQRECVHQFLVIYDPQYDESQTQRIKRGVGRSTRAPKYPEVYVRPAVNAETLSDEAAAAKANEVRKRELGEL